MSEKRLVAMMDKDTCSHCRDAHGQQVPDHLAFESLADHSLGCTNPDGCRCALMSEHVLGEGGGDETGEPIGPPDPFPIVRVTETENPAEFESDRAIVEELEDRHLGIVPRGRPLPPESGVRTPVGFALRPCPLCGCQALVETRSHDVQVRCSSPDCGCRLAAPDRDLAVSRWQVRVAWQSPHR